MADPERIWLQHKDDAASDTGRMWCEDKVWPNDPEDGEPTEYVRADLLAEARAQIAAKDAEIERLNGLLERAITAAVTAARVAVGAPARETV